MYQHTNTY